LCVILGATNGVSFEFVLFVMKMPLFGGYFGLYLKGTNSENYHCGNLLRKSQVCYQSS